MTMSKSIEKLKSFSGPLIRISLKITPYMTIASGFIIWKYLSDINRMDLFINSLSLKTGLISLLLSAFILTISLVVSLISPSYILIFFKINNKSDYTSATPNISFVLSIIFLIMIFLPHTDFFNKWSDGYEIPVGHTAFVIAALAASVCITKEIINFNFSNAYSTLSNARKKFTTILFNIVILFFSATSISLPVSLLLKSSKGEGTEAIVFALVFMIVFSFFSFLPSIAFYNEVKKQNINERNNKFFDNIKNCSLVVMFSIFSIAFIFPNISTIFIHSSLNSIGLIDKKTHYFKINGKNYKPPMFPVSIWGTQALPEEGDDFYIKGIKFFSSGETNLICPLYIAHLRDNAYQNDFSTFIPANDENKINYLKMMTRTCVVLKDPDIQLWDTLFDAAGQFKK